MAAELGFNVEACCRWRHETGQSTARGIGRPHSADDKAEFLRLLALHGNVSAVAKMGDVPLSVWFLNTERVSMFKFGRR